ncbi:hypothetical protein [Ideonella sp.]|jgi:hypothetical protein|uniref:hypothetical protein n=1 Tax=Ideonella sp. TaxID=1929293 RepID=UPI0037C08B50
MAIGQELLNVPMGDMIRQMAFAIAEAQIKLDESSIQVAEMMGGLKTVYNDEGEVAFDDSRVFFGYDTMTLKEAEAYLKIDDALSGGNVADALARLKKASGAVKDTDEVRVPVRMSMLELGFTPTFYQFVDTIIEVKIAIKITRESTYGTKSSNTLRTETNSKSSSGGGIWSFFGGSSNNNSRNTVQTSQVDASYQAKYGYSAEGSSLLRTKLSPLPPPPILEERIRRMMDAEEKRRLDKLPKPAPAPAP